MNIPYKYRGLGLLVLLVIVLPWTAWRFALYDTFIAWRQCRHLERQLATLAQATDGTKRPAVESTESILSGALLDTLRHSAPAGVRVMGYVPAVTLQQDGVEIHTAQLTLTGPFAELLRTTEALERRLPDCRMRSVEWRTTTQARNRRPQLILTLYIQQLTLKNESE